MEAGTEFQFGDWQISPDANLVSNGDARTQLEPRAMAVLRYLCRHPGAVIPAEEILQACWGSNEMGDNPVHKAITQLRRAFGDSSTEPRYIETIRKRGYRAIAPVVRLASATPTDWSGGSPFRGLEAFQENHSAIFFGRVQATAQLREVALAQAAHGNAMVLVLGPSGSGKTSLVRAGVLPQLMASASRPDEAIGLVSTVYLDCADLGSGTLFQALAGALIDGDLNGQPLFLGASADSLGKRLLDDTDEVIAELHATACDRPSVGVFVDRLEAIFRAPPGEAERFLAVLDKLARSNCLLIVMACRNDFYPEIMAQPLLLDLKSQGGHFDVMPPDGADIAQIVRQPARAASLTFEVDPATGASLDDVLCDAARGRPDTLPLLQYCLHELYRQRTEDGVLRFDVYRQLGGIEGAVGVRAEQVVSQLKPAQVLALPNVLSLLVNIGDEQAAVTSRRSPLSLLKNDDEQELARVMVEARLFVSELAGDVPSFGVAHEALLRQWPRVVEWVERHRSALQLRTRIAGQAARWVDSGRSRDLLLPHGIQVSQAADLLALKDFSLAPMEDEFVRASVAHARFADRVRIGVTTLIGILAVLTTFFWINARTAQQEAERNRGEAEGLMTFMLGDFMEKLRPIGRLDLLDDVGSKALTYLGKTNSSDTSSASLVNRIKALRLIAEVDTHRGRIAEARQTFLRGREQLSNAPSSMSQQADFVLEAGMLAFSLGQLHQEAGELDKAGQYYGEYRDYSDQLMKVAPHDVTSWLEGSHAHAALGALAQRRSDYSTAAAEFSKTLELQKKALKQRPGDEKIIGALANSISWNAESRLKMGNPAEAMKLYKEEEALFRSIHQNNANWSGKLALSLMRQGLLYTAFGDRASVIKVLHDAEQIMQVLVAKDRSNVTWKTWLLQAQGRLAEAQLTPATALQSYTSLQQICEKLAALAALDPKSTFLAYQIAKFELGRSAMLHSMGRDKEALQNADLSIAKLETMLEKAKSDPFLLAFLGEALLTRADLTGKLGDKVGSLPYCQRANRLLSNAPTKGNDYSLLALQVRAGVCADNTAGLAEKVERLQKMGYREARYVQSISSHPFLKGK